MVKKVISTIACSLSIALFITTYSCKEKSAATNNIQQLTAIDILSNDKSKPLIPLNDSTENLLIGDWKWEGSETDSGKTFLYKTYFLEIHEDKTFTKAYITRELTLEDRDITPMGYCLYGTWHIKDENLVLKWLETETVEAGDVENKLSFCNDDALIMVNCCGQIQKWERITTSKHYRIK